MSQLSATFNTSILPKRAEMHGESLRHDQLYGGDQENAMREGSYGVPDIASVSVQSTQAGFAGYQNAVSKKFNTYSGQTSGFSPRRSSTM